LNNPPPTTAAAATLSRDFFLEAANNAVFIYRCGDFHEQHSFPTRRSSDLNGSATFTNQGTLTKSTGAGTTSIGAVLNNSGTVSPQAGRISLISSHTNTGILAPASGATIGFDGGTTNFNTGSSLSGAGTVEF